MGFLKNKSTTVTTPQPAPLVDLVSLAATQLREQQDANEYAAEEFLRKSAEARTAADQHRKQAEATETAFTILADAGVKL